MVQPLKTRERSVREQAAQDRATELERAQRLAVAKERQRIAQALHDHLCQHLLGAAFAARALANSLDPASPAAAEAGELARLMNAAVQQTRDIVRGLNPADAPFRSDHESSS